MKLVIRLLSWKFIESCWKNCYSILCLCFVIFKRKRIKTAIIMRFFFMINKMKWISFLVVIFYNIFWYYHCHCYFDFVIIFNNTNLTTYFGLFFCNETSLQKITILSDLLFCKESLRSLFILTQNIVKNALQVISIFSIFYYFYRSFLVLL